MADTLVVIPSVTIDAFDAFLAERELRLEAVVIGGAALALLGVITRPTRDCDVLDPELPDEILAAARAFAGDERDSGRPLDDGWLNNGPRDLIRQLPSGWEEKLVPLYAGSALTLRTLGRSDLICSKLFALCDRALDLPDCLALAPTVEELAEIEPWLCDQDLNPNWPAHVRSTLADLARRLNHGL